MAYAVYKHGSFGLTSSSYRFLQWHSYNTRTASPPRHHASKTFELCEFVQHERRAPICEMRPLKPSQRTCLPSDDGLGACELRAGSTWTNTPAFSIAWSMPLSSLSTVGWSVPDYTVMVTHIDLRRHDTFHGQDKTVGKHGVLAYASRMLLLYFCWWL